ncbi:DUF4412 domain-containing protein [Pleomorphovibrio marinus]|uniref:DUF4412 domain-containing protein n=1 Tax=Pleomorphovibrio marinus TaxID=2164132 RepID=UPI000E0C7518|nr:DUF4412 domain-containing protein [Pleomorphovibrio marinus]
MYTKITVFALIFMFSLPLLSEAQLLRRLRNAAEEGVSRAVERRVEKEVERATQHQLEKAFGNLYGDSEGNMKGGGSFDFSKILSSVNLDVETEESYSFTGQAEMEITGTDEKGKEDQPMRIRSYLSDDPQFSGMEFFDKESQKEKERSVMIFDFKNNATIMLLEADGEKSSMAFGLDWQNMMDQFEDAEVDEEEEAVDLSDFSFDKTGNTKTILGYSCEEYVAKSEGFEASYWISKDPIEGLQSFWGKNSPFITQKMKAENKTYFESLPEGSLMEMEFTSEEDNTTTQITMKSIDENAPTQFSMQEYPNMMAEARAKEEAE